LRPWRKPDPGPPGASSRCTDIHANTNATKEEDESEDEFVTERKEPVPEWEVLAENKAVWEQFSFASN
jgi:hypothetical protein